MWNICSFFPPSRHVCIREFEQAVCGMIVECLGDPSPDKVAVRKRIRRRMCAGSHKRSCRPATSWDAWAKTPKERKALWDFETAPRGAQTQFFDSPVGGACKAPAPHQQNRASLSCLRSLVHLRTDPPPTRAFFFFVPGRVLYLSPSAPTSHLRACCFRMDLCVVGASESGRQGDGASANTGAPTTAEQGAADDAVKEAAAGTDPVSNRWPS